MDGKLTSSGKIANKSVVNITAGSTLLIGKDLIRKPFKGYISGVNVWDTLLEKHCIVALYRGNGTERGSVVSWSDVDIPGQFKSKRLLNSEEEHQGIVLNLVHGRSRATVRDFNLKLPYTCNIYAGNSVMEEHGKF